LFLRADPLSVGSFGAGIVRDALLVAVELTVLADLDDGAMLEGRFADLLEVEARLATAWLRLLRLARLVGHFDVAAAIAFGSDEEHQGGERGESFDRTGTELHQAHGNLPYRGPAQRRTVADVSCCGRARAPVAGEPSLDDRHSMNGRQSGR